MAAFWKFHSVVQMERTVNVHHSQAEFIFQINYRQTCRECDILARIGLKPGTFLVVLGLGEGRLQGRRSPNIY